MLLLPFVIIAAVAICAVASFFVRRHAESPEVPPTWTRTTEIFRDPSTTRLMRVWLDETGRHHYAPEGTLGPEH